jgi:hypothetical protein
MGAKIKEGVGNLVALGRRYAAQPARLLMLAVFEDAVAQFKTGPKRPRLFREVIAWFRSTEASALFSFESICANLGLDADYVRRKLGVSIEPPPPPRPTAEACPTHPNDKEAA